MADFQQYQKYRLQREGKGTKVGKIILILGILLVLYLIGRAIFGGGGQELMNNEANEVLNTNLNVQVNENVNALLNGNANANANINTNAAVSTTFNLENCGRTYSSGPSDTKSLALTFNVGTTKEGQIQRVIDSLKSASVPAAFFARGDVAEENPDLINKVDQAGFPIYNLSYNHPSFTDLPESGVVEQLEKADAAISQRTGKSTKPFFRPPYGAIDNDVFAIVKEQGYCPVTWSIDALDWSSDSTAESSKQRVLSKVANGSIVLMQASNSITAEILPSLITELQGEGYSIVSIEQLLKS